MNRCCSALQSLMESVHRIYLSNNWQGPLLLCVSELLLHCLVDWSEGPVRRRTIDDRIDDSSPSSVWNVGTLERAILSPFRRWIGHSLYLGVLKFWWEMVSCLRYMTEEVWFWYHAMSIFNPEWSSKRQLRCPLVQGSSRIYRDRNCTEDCGFEPRIRSTRDSTLNVVAHSLVVLLQWSMIDVVLSVQPHH
jgi:hypothetical protein